MILKSSLSCSPKLRQSFLQHSHHFHQYAPSYRRRKPSINADNPSFPDLTSHKDWLSTAEVIRMFQTLKDPNSALPLLSHLSRRKDYTPNESLYATVISKLELAGNFDGIETLMSKIKVERKCRLSDAFFHNVIKIYGHSAGRINKAIETLFEMPNYKCWPSVKTFNFVMNLLVNSKQFEVVHGVYSEASRLGIEIDACTLNIMIKAVCACGQLEAAHKLLDEFPHQKCAPNVRTFSTIMHGLCNHGRVDEAIGLMERMETAGVEADAVVFNILISGLRKNGRVDEGVGLFDQVLAKGCNPNPGTYLEVLHCLIEGKRFGEGKRLLERMIEKGMRPSFEAYKKVIQGFCGEGRVEDVEWVLRRMVGDGFMPRMGLWEEIVRCVVGGRGVVLFDGVCWDGICM